MPPEDATSDAGSTAEANAARRSLRWMGVLLLLVAIVIVVTGLSIDALAIPRAALREASTRCRPRSSTVPNSICGCSSITANA